MRLPYLEFGASSNKKYIVNFQGINYGEGTKEGELCDSMNISSRMYPCISQRTDRVKLSTYQEPTAIHAKNGIFVIDGTKAIYNNNIVGSVSKGKKQIATIGDLIVVFPDKAYFNTVTSEFGNLEKTYAAAASAITFTASSITTTGADFGFRVGDAVTVSGCTAHEENNKTAIVRGVEGKKLSFYDNTFTAGSESAAVTVKRSVPDLDYICESNYRLWGTKGNTIYASKYGDPFNFNVFDGLTGDSYYIDVGSDGDFTGCISYSSHICFFKENTLHKIYGSKPSNFQVVTSQVYGVQSGCEGSMCIINETLIYKGVNGVYAYTGGVPELISENFGTLKFSDAHAAHDGERYYISMRCGARWYFFVYDVLRNIWIKEDDTKALDMTFYNGTVYFLDSSGALYKISPDGESEVFEWSATFCPFNETINERKGYSKFHLRLDLGAESWFAVEIKTDNSNWKRIYTTHNERAKTISVPIIPTRCDSVSLRLRGKGRCIVRSFIREFFVGSDV